MSRDWLILIQDMKGFCEKIQGYADGVSREEFAHHGMMYDATVRNIELLGEAARQLPDDVRSLSARIEWAKIIAVRNILIHAYFGIDDDILWDIVQNKIGPLSRDLHALECELAKE
ncbi:MAG: HepT-like ribonuclease domain-containing protein [Blastocatellia bacterium]|nr:HepT-like ribonuclease domain-containing protein [Blastocatellia bacterium]